MENHIEIKNLKKSFGKKEVLKGIDLNVRKGEIFCLLGSNGAGKTTIVKILSTLLRGDEGKVTICGIDLFKNPSKVREAISLTGQYAAVDENLTGRENLYLIGRLKKLPDYKEKAQHYLEMFDLLDSADKKIKDYSGGMKRKLDISMSLLGDPKIIFLDEPTTGLDPQSRIALWDMIKSLSKNGITIFLTTQYLEEAEELSDYIAVLNEGVVVASGDATKLKSRLPNGKIMARFGNEEQVDRAAQALKEFDFTIDESKTLHIKTDSSIVVLSKIIELFKANAIEPLSLEKKSASLEDVYLKLISEKEQTSKERVETTKAEKGETY